jgi:murein DD-endopeptidase MepM/ murein hydrolase activator NlpD
MNTEKNNSGEHGKGILKQKGFYIAIAICIIAVASILLATMQGATGAKPSEQAAGSPSAQNVQNIEAPNLAQAEEAALKSPMPSASATASASEVPKNYQKAQISIQKPVDGDIAAVFCVDKLVYNKTLNIWQTHNGIDIVPRDNAEVKSALAGEVAQVIDDASWGNTVVINHADNLVTKYAGLADVKVAVGDKVQQGDVIGTCGTPPFEENMGTHLHFEVWQSGKPVDPSKIFAQK